jgi:hypothetical protein
MALGRCDHHRMFHDRLCPSFGGGNSSVQPRCPVRLPETDLVAQRPAVPGELRTRVRFAWRGGTRTVMPRISEDLLHLLPVVSRVLVGVFLFLPTGTSP